MAARSTVCPCPGASLAVLLRHPRSTVITFRFSRKSMPPLQDSLLIISVADAAAPCRGARCRGDGESATDPIIASGLGPLGRSRGSARVKRSSARQAPQGLHGQCQRQLLPAQGAGSVPKAVEPRRHLGDSRRLHGAGRGAPRGRAGEEDAAEEEGTGDVREVERQQLRQRREPGEGRAAEALGRGASRRKHKTNNFGATNRVQVFFRTRLPPRGRNAPPRRGR